MEMIREKSRHSRATIIRYIQQLRSLGCKITYDQKTQRYRVLDSGPFSIPTLKQYRWAAQGRGR